VPPGFGLWPTSTTGVVLPEMTCLASSAVREALAALKAARPESSGDLTLEELLAAVRQARANVPSAETSGAITSIGQLGDALESESEVPGDDELEVSPAGSRKWRDAGRLALRK
jgi:hypothetical protein